MEAIRTVNLTKKYKDVVAVDHLNFSIHEGELFSLLGVNGAGKTTTIKMLSTLTSPTSGNAIVYGKSINDNRHEVKRLIGLSPQETAVASNLTVKENLKLICGIHEFSKKKSIKKIDEQTEIFGLQQILNKRASKLSGGWQRKLSIAMALIGEPKILFLDEPTLGLDVIARSELWNTIRKLKGNTTIILTTHYMEEAEELSDRIGIMRAGRIICLGNMTEIKKITGEDTLEKSFIKLIKEDEH